MSLTTQLATPANPPDGTSVTILLRNWPPPTSIHGSVERSISITDRAIGDPEQAFDVKLRIETIFVVTLYTVSSDSSDEPTPVDAL